ncbi:MAG: hypothetical protein BIFFINMI_03727 [Phycisphaerae bacterium]|nr:hypothetical protein [Phycisphaerae bacterium]
MAAMSNPQRPSGGRATREAAERLRAIVRGLSPGDRLPSEAELARQLGRSATTIRAALRRLQMDGLVERLHGSGTFATDPARRTSTGVTGLIFYHDVARMLSAAYARESLWGVLEACDRHDQQVHIVSARMPSPGAVTLQRIKEMPLDRFDSMIVLEVFNSQMLEWIATQLPTVSLDYPCLAPGVSSVVVDHAHSVELAMDQAWNAGHRRIGYLGATRHPVDPASAERVSAYTEYMKHRGRLPEPAWLLEAHKAQDAWNQTQLWLTLPADSRPTAIFCEVYARVVAQALVAGGARVPRDVSLVTVGPQEPWTSELRHRRQWHEQLGSVPDFLTVDLLDDRLAPLRSMAITTVELPFHEMGDWAMEEVIRRRDPQARPRHEKMRGYLQPGNTVGPPRETD